MHTLLLRPSLDDVLLHGLSAVGRKDMEIGGRSGGVRRNRKAPESTAFCTEELQERKLQKFENMSPEA
jgi:hypothetical protein